MKVLLTGASGMFGTDLVDFLSPRVQTVGLVRTKTKSLPIPCAEGDLTDKYFVERAILEQRPDVVLHTAAMTHVDNCQLEPMAARQNNVVATENVVEACNQIGAFLVFFSTDYVFDGTKQGEYTEDDPTCPLNIYGETKKDAEKYIHDHAAKYLIFRVCWLYGIGGRSFPRTILERAPSQKEFDIVNDQIGRPTYTRDLAAAMRDLLVHPDRLWQKNSNQIFNLANEGTASWAEFAEFILSKSGYASTVRPITSDQMKRPAPRPKNSVLSLKKSKSLLNIEMRNWKDAAVDFLSRFNRVPGGVKE